MPKWDKNTVKTSGMQAVVEFSIVTEKCSTTIPIIRTIYNYKYNDQICFLNISAIKYPNSLLLTSGIIISERLQSKVMHLRMCDFTCIYLPLRRTRKADALNPFVSPSWSVLAWYRTVDLHYTWTQSALGDHLLSEIKSWSRLLLWSRVCYSCCRYSKPLVADNVLLVEFCCTTYY